MCLLHLFGGGAEPLSLGMASGTSALITDLKARGLLEDTIILSSIELGRMRCSQGSKGRDTIRSTSRTGSAAAESRAAPLAAKWTLDSPP